MFGEVPGEELKAVTSTLPSGQYLIKKIIILQTKLRLNTIIEKSDIKIANLRVTNVTMTSAYVNWEIENANDYDTEILYYFFTLSDDEFELLSNETSGKLPFKT